MAWFNSVWVERIGGAVLSVALFNTYSVAGEGDATISGDLTVGGALIVGQSAVTPSPANIITVSKDGNGDFSTIAAALASISDNGFTKRYLIRIAPGRYNEKIVMKSYVDIEGSGMNMTHIESDGGTSPTNSATVVGAPQSELRMVKAYSNAGWANPTNSYALAVLYDADGFFSIRDSDLAVVGAAGSGDCTGLYITTGMRYMVADRVSVSSQCSNTYSYGVFNSGSITLNSSTVLATSAGSDKATAFRSDAPTPTHQNTRIWNSKLEAYNSGNSSEVYAIEITRGDVWLRHSQLISNGDAVYTSGGSTRLATSELQGQVKSGSGTLKCFQLFTRLFDAFSCP